MLTFVSRYVCLDITMYETLLRPHEVHAPPPLRAVAEVAADLKQAAVIREQKRLLQIAASDARRAQLAAAGMGGGGKKRQKYDEDAVYNNYISQHTRC